MDPTALTPDQSDLVQEFVEFTEVGIPEAIDRLQLAEWKIDVALFMYFQAQGLADIKDYDFVKAQLDAKVCDSKKKSEDSDDKKEYDAAMDKQAIGKKHTGSDDKDDAQSSGSRSVPVLASGNYIKTQVEKECTKPEAQKQPSVCLFSMPKEGKFSEANDAEQADTVHAHCSSTSAHGIADMSRIVTLDSLRLREERESLREDMSACYAGGSVTSGQQILEPEKKKVKKSKKIIEGKDERERKNLIQGIFRAALKHGAEAVDDTTSHEDSVSLTFRRRTDYPAIASPNKDVHEPKNTDEPHEVYLYAWRNGFTVDNGPLRDYDSVENRAFLATVSRGEIPADISDRYHGGEIFLNLQDCSGQEYESLKKILLPFSGTGRRLGSPTPNVAGNRQLERSNKEKAEKVLHVDEKKPVTQVQVRLSDGSRLVIRLNHTHTVHDIREYIVVARPEYSASVFSLVSRVSTELADDYVTLEQADLLNSVVFQRLGNISEEDEK